MNYTLEYGYGDFIVKIACNETMAHTSNINFYLESGRANETVFLGQSYFGKRINMDLVDLFFLGCPVKDPFNRYYLRFD